MKQQSFIMFLKYPYSMAVMACIWIGSAVMVFINQDLPILFILIINVIASWIVAWISFRPGSLK